MMTIFLAFCLQIDYISQLNPIAIRHAKMNKIYLTVLRLLLLLLIPVYSLAQQAEWEWVKHAGEVNDQIGKALETDDEGNVYLTGYFIHKVIFENDTLISIGGSDIYLAKYDSDGNKCWVKQAGGVNGDFGHDITIDKSGNILITGYIGGNGLVWFDDTSIYVNGNTDIFLAKYDHNGHFLWVRKAGGNYTTQAFSSWDDGRSVITDSYDNVYITGSFRDTAVFNKDTLFSFGDVDLFIAKYSANGDLIWVDNYGGKAADNGNTIIIDNNDNLYLAGWIKDTARIADTVLIPYDDMDNFIVKLNSNGERIWIKQMGGSSAYAYRTSIAVDSNNNLYVTDYFAGTVNLNDTTLIANGNIDFYLSKYDPNGKFLWARQYFDVFNIQSHALTIDENNNLYITGSFRGTLLYLNDTVLTPYGNDDIFVAKFDSEGNFVWIIGAGGVASDTGLDITWNNNNVYITGWYTGIATFGDIILPSYGIYNNRNIFIARIKDNTVEINQFYDDPTISIYPNPSNGIFYLKVKDLKGKANLEIFNINGYILYERRLSDGINLIDIKNYPPGLYFVRILSGDFIKTEKMLKY